MLLKNIYFSHIPLLKIEFKKKKIIQFVFFFFLNKDKTVKSEEKTAVFALKPAPLVLFPRYSNCALPPAQSKTRDVFAFFFEVLSHIKLEGNYSFLLHRLLGCSLAFPFFIYFLFFEFIFRRCGF
jgi:hypothetical protein